MSSAFLLLFALGCTAEVETALGSATFTSAFTGLAVFSIGAGRLAVGTDTLPTPAGL